LARPQLVHKLRTVNVMHLKIQNHGIYILMRHHFLAAAPSRHRSLHIHPAPPAKHDEKAALDFFINQENARHVFSFVELAVEFMTE
jgi:hypothetical protein